MGSDVTIRVVDVLGTPLCTAPRQAQQLFEKLKTHLENDDNIVLSFAGYTMLVHIFLDLAIGQLYVTFDEEKIKDRLHVVDLSPDDKKHLSLVARRMKRHRQDPETYNAVWKELKRF